MNELSGEKGKVGHRGKKIQKESLQKMIMDQINLLAFSTPGLNSRIKRTFSKP